MALTDAQQDELYKWTKEIREALYTKAGRKKLDALDEWVKKIVEKVGA